MNLSFNYYHKLDDVEFYLCNPDGRELFPIVAKDRTVTLRFNDLSVIEFNVPAKLEKSDGTVIDKVEYYDYVETMRLIFATKIGWFKIVSVTENDDGIVKSKSVTAESLQTIFKDRGFLSEERAYKFYNPDDPTDSTYDASDDGAIPSVVGQLVTQLGIRLDLNQGLDEPEQPYDEWTITYINEHLHYTGTGSTCRTFTDGVTCAYDWMVNDVEDAFEVILVFDFMNRAIQIKAVSEVATRSNLCFSFSNFMNNVEVVEDASNITTVLSCNGNGVDITGVNPTGTNYIVDFSYYMDKVKHRWMSNELIEKLEEWADEVDDSRDNYTTLIAQLREQYASHTDYNTKLTMISTVLKDLKNARDKYITAESISAPLSDNAVFSVESIEVGDMSDDVTSNYNEEEFMAEKTVVAHFSPPRFDVSTDKWTFDDDGMSDTATNCFNLGLYYFIDSGDQSSYCRLTGKATLDTESGEATYACAGFTRYVRYVNVNDWIKIRESQVTELNSSINTANESIATINGRLNAISSELNLLKYLSSTPSLLRELNCYWVEGDYTNDNIAVTDRTTSEGEIDLANELLEIGKLELSKVCQPRLSFTLEASNALTRYEFRNQMREIELGKIITVEKEDGLWYYPTLLEMTFSLDNVEDFNMVFANAFRLDDWGYTYADLISDASETSRQIGANWQDLMKYSKERAEISDLIKNPLDTTLRAAFANMVNQEFITDDTGILGRKFKFEDSAEFEDEQIRIVNNVILFTDDGWDTVRSALGKVYYREGDTMVSSYGLIADALIGNLLIGKTLKINNEGNTIVIDGNGISITTSDNDAIFRAGTDGSLFIRNYATHGDLVDSSYTLTQAFEVANGQLRSDIENTYVTGETFRTDLRQTSINIKAEVVSKRGGDGKAGSQFGWELLDSGFYIYGDKNNNGTNRIIAEFNDNGAVFSGTVNMERGSIGNWTIDDGRLMSSGDGTGYGVGIQCRKGARDYFISAGFDAANILSSWKGGKFYVKFDGTLYSKGGTFDDLNAVSGSIGNWVIEDGVMHSLSGTAGSYVLPDDTNTILEGYAFAVLESVGLKIIVKRYNDYKSATLGEVSVAALISAETGLATSRKELLQLQDNQAAMMTQYEKLALAINDTSSRVGAIEERLNQRE